ncbi:MAG: hypothetical protein AAF599_00020 [Bacteroidota bacterium]
MADIFSNINSLDAGALESFEIEVPEEGARTLSILRQTGDGVAKVSMSAKFKTMLVECPFRSFQEHKNAIIGANARQLRRLKNSVVKTFKTLPVESHAGQKINVVVNNTNSSTPSKFLFYFR